MVGGEKPLGVGGADVVGGEKAICKAALVEDKVGSAGKWGSLGFFLRSGLGKGGGEINGRC